MKDKRVNFFLNLIIVLVVLVGICFGGYVYIDKTLIPQYFSEFGINRLSDLVTMVRTMYNTPEESAFITNPYTKDDEKTAVKQLEDMGFPMLDSSTIDFNSVKGRDYEISYPSESVCFSDKQIAALLNQMFESGVMEKFFEGLSYINTINMECLEVVIKPSISEEGILNPYSANLYLTVKLNTTTLRAIMAEQMDVPLFLIEMVVPKVLYLTTSLDIELNTSDPDETKWSYSNERIAVNGRTAKQSEILLNLLIRFIFDESYNMTIELLAENIGDVAKFGLNLIGERIEFTNDISYGTKKINGIKVLLD